MRYLLDTCLISELIKPRPRKSVVEWVRAQEESDLFISVLTLGKLERGISKLHEGRKKRRLQTWIDRDLKRRFQGRIVPVNEDIACAWGSLSAQAERNGGRVPAMDGLIAATAQAHDLTLVTRNTADMEATSVRLLDPWRA